MFRNIAPKVEVLLSSYNGEKYIAQQLDSILRQEGVEVSCLIRDDGSRDETLSILRDYRNYNNNVELIEGNNEGFSRSFYHLVEASGDYQFFAFSDQDDYWLPEKLKRGISAINGGSDIPEMYFCNATLVDSELKPIRIMFDNLHIPDNRVLCLLECLSAGCTIVFNRAARDYFLKGDIKKIGYHDFWMYDICALLGKVVYDPEPFINYRQHGNNIIGSGAGAKTVWKRRIKQVGKKTHLREDLASELVRCFSDKMNQEQRNDIKLLVNYRNSFWDRLKLLFAKRLYMNTPKKQFWFKMHVILGNV